MLSRIRYIALLAAALASFVLLSGCASREERIQRALGKANEHLLDDRPTRAVETLRSAAKRFKESAEIQEELGDALANNGQIVPALAALRKAVELDPDRARLWVSIGDLERSIENDESAIAAYQRYLEFFPSDFLAWRSLTQLQRENEDRAAAIQSALQWNKARPSAEPSRILGQLFLEAGNIPQARSWFSQAAAYIEGEAARDALASLIELEIDLQQFLPAETWVERYRERYPNAGHDARVIEARDVLGKWREAQREIAEATAQIGERQRELEAQRRSGTEADQGADATDPEEMLETEPDEELLEVEDEPSPASDAAPEELASSETAQEGIAKEPTPLAEPDEETGVADREPATTQAATEPPTTIDGFWNALGQNPDDIESWRRLAELYADDGNFVDAEACILEAKRRAPLSPEINALYLTIIAQTQEPKRVISEATEIRSRFPQSPPVLLGFAQAIREANAAPRRIADAYQAFLDAADSSTPGYEEARRYLRQGN